MPKSAGTKSQFTTKALYDLNRRRLQVFIPHLKTKIAELEHKLEAHKAPEPATEE